jgi:hypothetical protein
VSGLDIGSRQTGLGVVPAKTTAAVPARAVSWELPAWLVRGALGAVVAIVFGSVALLAVAHVDDRYHVNHVAGSWMALAELVRSGTLVPPLFEDGFYGGTRYMPLTPLLHGAAAWITDELVVSGKIVAYATSLLLYALVFIVLRRVGCSRLVSLALIALVLVTPVGLLAATGIRGDTLATLLQVGAVALVLRSSTPRTLAAAGALSALAVTSKLTAVWAVLAIGIWLLVRGRSDLRKLATFAAAFVGSLVALLALLEVASGGNLSDSIFTALFGRTEGSRNSLPESVSTVFQLLTASGIWLLLPLALFAALVGLATRRPTLLQLAFLVQIPILVLVFTEQGADFNQFLDLTVVTVLVVGELWALAGTDERRLAPVAAIAVLAVVLGAAESFRVSMKSDVVQAANELAGRASDRYPTDPLAGYVDASDTILSEDPTIPLLLGQRPIVQDASMLPLIEKRQPELIRDLRQRVETKGFSKVILMKPITDRNWYSSARKFGDSVSEAIRRNYQLQEHVVRGMTDYWIYRPA